MSSDKQQGNKNFLNTQLQNSLLGSVQNGQGYSDTNRFMPTNIEQLQSHLTKKFLECDSNNILNSGKLIFASFFVWLCNGIWNIVRGIEKLKMNLKGATAMVYLSRKLGHFILHPMYPPNDRVQFCKLGMKCPKRTFVGFRIWFMKVSFMKHVQF